MEKTEMEENNVELEGSLTSDSNGSTALQVPKIHKLNIEDDGTASNYSSTDELDTSPTKANDTWEPPTPELLKRIIGQVEFYFSDENLAKDAFLLKHVRRNKEGFVSLKLITSFKKVKTLSKDWRVVKYSLEHSPNLEVNGEGTKVRRVAPVPEFEQATPSKSVIALNFPAGGEVGLEVVADVFKDCGDIASIRIIKPGKPVPQDLRKYKTKHPELGAETCAVVEFEARQGVEQALARYAGGAGANGLTATELLSDATRKKEKASPAARKNPPRKDAEDSGGEGDGGKQPRRRKAGGGGSSQYDWRLQELRDGESAGGSSSEGEMSPMAPRRSAPYEVGGSRSPKGSPHSSPRSSPLTIRKRNDYGTSPLASPQNARSPQTNADKVATVSPDNRSSNGGGGGGTSSPWVQRRRMLAQGGEPGGGGALGGAAGGPAGSDSPMGSPLLRRSAPNVVRQPKGPDGTKGFSIGRGRPRATTVL